MARGLPRSACGVSVHAARRSSPTGGAECHWLNRATRPAPPLAISGPPSPCWGIPVAPLPRRRERGWADQRFAGNESAFGSAEVRLRMWRPRVVVPLGIGVFGFADAGRVYVDGSSPGGWHTSLGGGLWFQPVRQPYIVRAGIGISDESTKLFVMLGLPY